MGRFGFVAVVCVSFWGCSGPGGGDPGTAPDAGGADAGPMEPVVAFPDVWGPGSVLADESDDPDVVEVHLTARNASVSLSADTTLDMMTYEGQVPGPLLTAKVGDEIVVHFTNELDEETTVHWHGLRISDQMDGSPRIQAPVQPGETFVYRFVAPEAGTFWYHPHVRAHEQVEKGLYGTIVIRDADDPEYSLERMVVLDDILLDPDAPGMFPPFLASHPEVMHGRYGNVLLTNGRVSEEARTSATRGEVERWRVVNVANARTMELTVEGATFRVIGVDGGKLREPYTVDRLFVPVGQRYDLEVSYGEAGEARLVSNVATLNDAGDVVEVGIPVLAVDVADSTAAPRIVEWPVLPERPARAEAMTVTMMFEASMDPFGGLRWSINGEEHHEGPLFTFQQGDTVRMRLVNTQGPEHPFHLHGQFFEVVDGGAVPGPQQGLKDTVLVPGLQTVEIVAYLDNPGQWMAHCHILEHAQLGMMTEIVVEPAE